MWALGPISAGGGENSSAKSAALAMAPILPSFRSGAARAPLERRLGVFWAPFAIACMPPLSNFQATSTIQPLPTRLDRYFDVATRLPAGGGSARAFVAHRLRNHADLRWLANRLQERLDVRLG